MTLSTIARTFSSPHVLFECKPHFPRFMACLWWDKSEHTNMKKKKKKIFSPSVLIFRLNMNWPKKSTSGSLFSVCWAGLFDLDTSSWQHRVYTVNESFGCRGQQTKIGWVSFFPLILSLLAPRLMLCLVFSTGFILIWGHVDSCDVVRKQGKAEK